MKNHLKKKSPLFGSLNIGNEFHKGWSDMSREQDIGEPISDELRVEFAYIDIIMEKAEKRWPQKKDRDENFIIPVFGERSDPGRLRRILEGKKGKNNKQRRITLSEAMRAAKLLGTQLHYLVGDSEMAVQRREY